MGTRLFTNSSKLKIIDKTKHNNDMNKGVHIIIVILLTFCMLPFFTHKSAAVDPQVHLFSEDSSGTIDNPYDIGMVMYSKPSFAGNVIMTLMNGTPVIVLSEPKEAEGYRWVLVQTNERNEGWVFATGVKDPNGNLPSPQISGGNPIAYGSALGTTASTALGTKYTTPNTNSESSIYSGYSNNNNSNYYYNNGSSGGGQVWIYETGRRYHSHAGCSGSGDWAVSREQAESMGRTPCQKYY